MTSINERLVVDALDVDVDREAESLAVLRFTDVHARVHRHVLCRLRAPTLARDHLHCAQEARCGTSLISNSAAIGEGNGPPA